MDYTTDQKTAYDMISEYGTLLTLTYITMGTYITATDSFTNTSLAWSLPYLDTKCKLSDFGDSVMSGDRTFIIPGIDSNSADLPRLDISKGTSRKLTIKVQSRVWIPVNIFPVCPGGTVILYKIQARS
jgi:hypothetical protein